MKTLSPKHIQNRLRQYLLLARFDKPIGIYILLWPVLWALWVATDGAPDILILFVFCAGTVLMRAAGCVINDFADRKFDGSIARTKQRPMVTGEVKPKEAIILFCVLALSAFALVLLLNTMTIILSFVGVFLAVSYPFIKRYTHLPQAYLGIAFGWAVPMVFVATTETMPLVAWLMYLAVILWSLVYDTMYAMVDRDDDLKVGIKSSAILFGKHDRAIIAILQSIMLALLLAVGQLQLFGVYYYLGLAVAASLSIYQQKLIFYCRQDDCFKAFLNNNWLGMAIFGGLLANFFKHY